MTPTDFRTLVRELRLAQRRVKYLVGIEADKKIIREARDERDRLAAAVDAELGMLVSE